MDRLLRRRPEEGAGDPHRDLHAPRRSDPARRHSRHSARRRLVLSRHLSLRRGVEPARSRRRAGSEGRVGARRGRQPAVAHGRDQAAICRPRQAGRPDRLAMPRRRLCQPLRRRGRRRHRSGRHGQGDLGDVHALRSARGHGDAARLLVDRARSDGLCQRRSAQCARGDRRLQAVQAPRHVSRSWCGRARRSRRWCAGNSPTCCRAS